MGTICKRRVSCAEIIDVIFLIEQTAHTLELLFGVYLCLFQAYLSASAQFLMSLIMSDTLEAGTPERSRTNSQGQCPLQETCN